MNGVTTRGGISQPLQDNDSASAAENGAIGLRVKGTHLPVWRHHSGTIVKVTGFVRNANRNGVGQSNARLFEKGPSACEMDGHQRGRAGSLDCDAGALQIEFVRYPGAKKILVVYDQGRDVFFGKSALQAAVHEVRVHGGAGEHPNASLVTIRVASSVFKCFISQFQKYPVLWVHGSGFLWGEAEKCRIKCSWLFKNRCGLHVIRVPQIRGRNAGLDNLLIRKPRDGLNAACQVLPEHIDARCTWKSAGHTDDCDIKFVIHRIRSPSLESWVPVAPFGRPSRWRSTGPG